MDDSIPEIGNTRTDIRPGAEIDVAFSFYVQEEAGEVELDIDKAVIVIFGKSTKQTFKIDISEAEALSRTE